LSLRLGHFVQESLDLLLFIIVLAKVVVAQDVATNLLEFLHIHGKVCEPGFAVLLHHDAGHLETCQCNLKGRIQETTIRPKTIIDHPPSRRQQLLLMPQILLDKLQERPIRLVHNQTAVHVLQKIELTLQDVRRPIRELLTVGIVKLVLDDLVTGRHESGVGDDSKFLNFGRQEDCGGGEEEGVHGSEGVSGVEAFKVDDGCGDDLLTEFEGLAQRLHEVAKEDKDLLILLLSQDVEVSLSVSGQVLTVQDPLLPM